MFAWLWMVLAHMRVMLTASRLGPGLFASSCEAAAVVWLCLWVGLRPHHNPLWRWECPQGRDLRE